MMVHGWSLTFLGKMAVSNAVSRASNLLNRISTYVHEKLVKLVAENSRSASTLLTIKNTVVRLAKTSYRNFNINKIRFATIAACTMTAAASILLPAQKSDRDIIWDNRMLLIYNLAILNVVCDLPTICNSAHRGLSLIKSITESSCYTLFFTVGGAFALYLTPAQFLSSKIGALPTAAVSMSAAMKLNALQVKSRKEDEDNKVPEYKRPHEFKRLVTWICYATSVSSGSIYILSAFTPGDRGYYISPCIAGIFALSMSQILTVTDHYRTAYRCDTRKDVLNDVLDRYFQPPQIIQLINDYITTELQLPLISSH